MVSIFVKSAVCQVSYKTQNRNLLTKKKNFVSVMEGVKVLNSNERTKNLLLARTSFGAATYLLQQNAEILFS